MTYKMQQRISDLIFSVFVIGVSLNVPTALVAEETFHKSIQPFLKSYCVKCHGDETMEGELRLDTIPLDFVNRPSAGHWIEVLDRVNLGEMPPTGEPQPSASELAQFADWVTAQLQVARHKRESTGGQVLLRRLTRQEYAHTVRDLLGVDFVEGEGPIDLLPPDGSIRGFDRNSQALFVDPSLMNAYFEVAAIVANQAIRFRPPVIPQRTVRFDYKDIATSAMKYQIEERTAYLDGETLVVMAGGARSFGKLRHPYNEKEVPVTGRYRVRIQASSIPGKNGDPIYMRIAQGAQDNIAQFRVDASRAAPEVYEFETVRDEMLQGEYQVRLVNDTSFQTYLRNRGENARFADQRLEEGHPEEATLLKSRLRAQGEDIRSMYRSEVLDLSHIPKLRLDWIEVIGPLQEEYPPASMQMFFPDGWESERLTIDYATQVFRHFLGRAYRRPVTKDEVAEIVGLVQAELANGNDFQTAIKTGIIATLCSPNFLYLFEPERSESQPRKLSQHELSTRLSYFLWSSLPDEELQQLAESKQLTDSEVLNKQIERMLKDARIEGFMNSFVRQWLKIDEFNRFPPDRAIFPEYYETHLAGIDEDLLEQPLQMVKEILHQDESLLNLLDSDWTMLNERLATYYEIQGVTGEQFQRVRFEGNSSKESGTYIRGGLLGMAGVHRWGSDGSRTKPVDRGKYILDVFFNDPPPPPPPNAGEIEPNLRGEKLTVPERLARHREQVTCNNCHRRIDPYGLALENFNVIGQWRTHVDGERPLSRWGKDRPEIKIGETLPSGEVYHNYASFKKAMIKQDERFLRGLSEKLLTYALARSLEPADRSLIDLAVKNCQQEGETLRSIIRTIVTSETFRRK